MRRGPEEKENRIPYCLLFPFCPGITEEEGVDAGYDIVITKKRLKAWFSV